MPQASQVNKQLIIRYLDQTVHFEFAGFCKQKYVAHDCFLRNGQYGKIMTK